MFTLPNVIGIAAVVAAFLGAIVLLVFLAKRSTHLRTEALARFAAENGFTYVEQLPGGTPPAIDLRKRVYATEAARTFLQQFGDCALFTNGTWRNVRNIIAGRKNGFEWIIFDYQHWTEGKGQAESEVVQETCVVVRAQRAIGWLSIEPKLPVVGTLMTRFGHHDILQTGDPEFDGKFLVRSANAQQAREVLSPPVREYLLGLYNGPKRWYRHMHVYNDLVIVSEACATVPHVSDMMDIAARFVALA